MCNFLFLINGQTDPCNYIPYGWKHSKLDQLCEIFGGGRLGFTKEKSYQSSGFLAFSAAGPDGFVEHAEFKDTDGIILSSIGANCGRCFYASGSWSTLANVQAIIPKNEINANYLFYFVNRVSYWDITGSAQPFIKPSSIRSSWVVFPSSKLEQFKIAEILSTVDHAIEQTEALLAKQDHIKTGLMQDFLSRGIDEKGNIRSEHTHQFKDSPLGRIPAEWEIVRLGNISHISSGVTLGKYCNDPNSIELPYLRVANVQDGYLDLSEVKVIRILNSDIAKYQLEVGDVLMNEGGDFDKLGRGTVWNGEIENCLHQNHVFKVRPKTGILEPYYLTMISSSPYGKAFFILASKQSTNLASINSTQLKSFLIPLPTFDEQLRIINIVNKSTLNYKTTVAQLNKLLKIKVALMQDLLTGKKRVTALLKEPAVACV